MSISDTTSAPSRRQSNVANVLQLPPETRTPFYPPVSRTIRHQLLTKQLLTKHHSFLGILLLLQPLLSPDERLHEESART